MMRQLLACVMVVFPGVLPASAGAAGPALERVTTAAPFPRGLAVVDGDLYVLCRGRVRGAGGVSAAIEDQAGTIYRVDLSISEPAGAQPVSDAVRNNGEVFALPTDPPFHLWDRAADPPETDRLTDRPYCTLRYHEPTQSFYLCAFSGIDKPRVPGRSSFSKNTTDALLRFDRRTGRWHEVERHDVGAGGNYPHHDPAYNDPPHGWMNGPDNCLALGDQLYAVSKDNSLLVRYDLSALADDPDAGAPPSEVAFGEWIDVRGRGAQQLQGQSALAFHDGWLYVGYRTSSVIVRFLLDESMSPVQPIQAEVIARFDPYDPQTGRSADITDMDFDGNGRLYVVSAKPARLFRLTPDPKHVFDARSDQPDPAAPWADLAAMTNNPNMKSENVMVHAGRVYVTSGDGYDYQQGAAGTVYRLPIED